MANIALYRRYRSKTFDELIGQEHVTEPLIAALRNGRLNHAYLFSGPRGCGKTSSARILARSVNCVKGPTPTPCGECESCRALAPDGPGSIDVIEIDAASHGGVDDARELREKAFFAPVSSRYKVYVIDEAHMVSSAGFNALLKLVEEPPDYVMFVFATTEPDKVLGTIRSRTHHYPFRLVPPGTMRAHLERVCAAEGVTVDPLVFPLVVRAGGGSVRDSMSILDQLLAGAGPEGVSYQHALGLLGVTDVGLIDDACQALGTADGAGLLATVDKVVEAGHDPRRFASDLLERLRDLIILNQVPDAASNGLLDVPPDRLERLTGQALRLGPATLSRMADILNDGLAAMRGATSPRLVLELLCARMLLPGDESAADLMQRMERLERRLDIAGPAAAAAAPAPATQPAPAAAAEPTPSAPAAPAPGASAEPASAEATGDAARSEAAVPQRPAPVPAQAAPQRAAPQQAAPQPPAAQPAAATRPASGALDIGAVGRAWDLIVEHTKKRRVVWSLLQNAAPFALESDTLVLNARNAGVASRFNDDSVTAVVQEALAEVLGVKWRVRCQVEGGGGGGAGRAPSRPTPPPAPPAAEPSGGPATGPVSGPNAGSGGDPTAGPAAGASGGPVDDGGWPATASPGGESAAPGGAAPGGQAASGGGGPAATAGQAGGVPRPAGAGGAAASDGAAVGGLAGTGGAPGVGAAAGRGGAGGAAREGMAPAGGGVAVAERVAGEDVPWPADGPTDFSPDDPVPSGFGGGTPGVDGFAPGDEPLDGPAPAPDPADGGDERALRLLSQALGAQRIDDAAGR